MHGNVQVRFGGAGRGNDRSRGRHRASARHQPRAPVDAVSRLRSLLARSAISRHREQRSVRRDGLDSMARRSAQPGLAAWAELTLVMMKVLEARNLAACA